MKKLPLILLSFTPMIIGGLFSPKVSATGVYDNRRWWTPQELATHFTKKNAEREALCLDNVDCHNSVLGELMAEDEFYRVGYNLLMNTRFIISSINRGNNTVEIYFNNDDIDVSKLNPGWRDSDLMTLFIGWFDGPLNQIYEVTDDNLFQPNENRHTLYAETANTMGRGWLPSQTFLSIPLLDSSYIDAGHLAYYAHSGFYYQKDVIDLSVCNIDPNWGSCDLFISEDGEARFFAPGEMLYNTDPVAPPDGGEEPIDEPVEPTIDPIEPEPEPEPTPAQDTPAVLIPETPQETASQVASKSVISLPESIQATDDTKVDEKTDSIDIPLAGNVAPLDSKKCGKIDFPWWFLIMILVGDIIAVWIFMPSRHQSLKRA